MRIVKSKEEMGGLTNSALGMRRQKIFTIGESSISDNVKENMVLLEECRKYWDSLRDFRKRRLRNRKYYRGDQWSDEILDPETNKYISEETYLKNQGKIPLKQNQVRQLVKNLIGQYRSNPSKSMVIARSRDNAQVTEMLTNALQCALGNNLTDELDARIYEEFALSGAIPQKIGYKYWKERNLEDLYIENVNPNRLFFNSDVSDIRLHDLRLIGEVIDTTVNDIVSTFAKSSADELKIRLLYSSTVSRDLLSDSGLDPTKLENLDFFIPQDPSKARLFEVWKLQGKWRVYAHDPMDGSFNIVPFTMKEIALQNQERLKLGIAQGMPVEEIPLIEAEEKFEQFWYVRFLTPFGHCLFEGETPYKHEEHPYALTLYPLLDGEVWGFVEDIIDQQRYINRLIIMMDFIMSASAKGVLLVPEDIIPDGMNPDDFAKEWTRFNGVITYTPKAHGKIPEQISANSTSIGISEMIALQMQLIQEISGVHGAIQGKNAQSGTPAALYAQEAQNATLNTLDSMQTFQYHKQKRDLKALKVIAQYYKDKRYLAINGRTINEATKLYDPELVRNIDFDVVVVQGSDTPVYRQMIDETLMKLLEGQMIDLEMFLEHTSLPFADKLLASVRQRKEQIAQTGEIPPEIITEAQAASASSNPQALAMANQFLGKQVA
jgi:hypothetical protein